MPGRRMARGEGVGHSARFLLLLLVLLGCGCGRLVAQTVPSVNECSLCMDCLVEGEAEAGGGATVSPAPALTGPRAFSKLDPADKQKLPVCQRCKGCNTRLSRINGMSTYFNITYKHEEGASSTWTFKASTKRTPNGEAVAKVYCVPVDKVKNVLQPKGCSTSAIMKVVQINLAMDQVAGDCGFHDVVPRVWLDRVEGVVPNIGYHVHWHGMWQEMVAGVSLENYLQKGQPRKAQPPQVLDLFHNKLNKTQVVRAAMFDLLTSQCDRHAQNIFLLEDGNIKLIDNEVCLGYSWSHCAFDSIFLPTTQKQEIARMGNHFIQKGPTAVPPEGAQRGAASPQMLLDYRCYLGGAEELGTNYPPQVKQCLKKISGMSVEEVKSHYNLPEMKAAKNLHSRASDMLTKGFEWAYKHGEPQNFNARKYMVQPKCCQVKWEQGHFRCAHEWNVKYEIPFGDQANGRPWNKPYPDMGTYEGGSRQQR